MDADRISEFAGKCRRKWIKRQLAKRPTTAQEHQRRLGMQQRLMASAQNVLQYENLDAQVLIFVRDSTKDKALAVIPVDRLHEEARAQRESEPSMSFEDLVLKRLLVWFKQEFFTWTNQPPCPAGCTGVFFLSK